MPKTRRRTCRNDSRTEHRRRHPNWLGLCHPRILNSIVHWFKNDLPGGVRGRSAKSRREESRSPEASAIGKRDPRDDVSSLHSYRHACMLPFGESDCKVSLAYSDAAQSPHYVTSKPRFPRKSTSRRYRHANFHRTGHETLALLVSPDHLCHTCRRGSAADVPGFAVACCG